MKILLIILVAIMIFTSCAPLKGFWPIPQPEYSLEIRLTYISPGTTKQFPGGWRIVRAFRDENTKPGVYVALERMVQK